MFTHALDVNSQCFMLSDFVAFRRSFVNRDEQVLNFFVIDFHHRYINFILFVFIWVFGNPVENLFAGDGNDTLSKIKFTLLAP